MQATHKPGCPLILNGTQATSVQSGAEVQAAHLWPVLFKQESSNAAAYLLSSPAASASRLLSYPTGPIQRCHHGQRTPCCLSRLIPNKSACLGTHRQQRGLLVQLQNPSQLKLWAHSLWQVPPMGGILAARCRLTNCRASSASVTLPRFRVAPWCARCVTARVFQGSLQHPYIPKE